MKNHYLSFLLLLLVEGVFSDVMMSVMEGDSVTLQIDVTEIQGNETLLWKFNGKDEFMAKINRETNKITVPEDNNDGRFKNRLQVDQIGSLTITNIRTEDSALYTLEIRNSRTSYKRFNVTVYRVSDVETKPVIMGESVILKTDFTEIQKGDEIQWSYFTPEETRIARVNIGAGDKNITVFNGADGRFNDRLFLNSETGSLIISDITTELSGLYKLEVNGSQTTSKMFRVTVIDVSVMEGESVTLQTGLTGIKKGDELQWSYFTPEETLIAGVIIGAGDMNTRVFNVSADVRFRDRLTVNSETGNLNISDVTTEHSGLYKLQINRSQTKPKMFRVTVSGVSDVETKSVIKGDSVTLQTGLTGLQKDDEIQWSYFTPEETPIARLTIGTGDKNTRVFDDADVRFRDRLTVNSKTGSLIISDVRTERSGHYKVKITGSQTESKIFRVTVSVVRYPDPGLSSGAKTGIIVAVLLLVAAAAGVIYYRCFKKQKATGAGGTQVPLNGGS